MKFLADLAFAVGAAFALLALMCVLDIAVDFAKFLASTKAYENLEDNLARFIAKLIIKIRSSKNV